MPPLTAAEQQRERNILSIDELRRVEQISDKFAQSFRYLESPTPPPLRGERPADYNRRLIAALTDETMRGLARADRADRPLSDDERSLVRSHGLVSTSAGRAAAGDEALGHIAATAHRVAAALGSDSGQGSFARPGETRVVTENVNGHTVRSYYGNTASWLDPFRQLPGLTVAGGLLSKMLADPSYGYVRRAPAPRQYQPAPPALGPQPNFATMLADVVQAAVASALPARRGRK